MFKIKSKTPSVEDDIEIIADYIEVKCILSNKKSASVRKIITDLAKPADTFETSGVEDLDDKVLRKIELISAEFQRRILATNERYPFEIKLRGEVLRFKGMQELDNILYVYLLFATRLNMAQNRMFNNIDGTGILERVCSYVATNYFGSRSKYLILGTSAPGGFEQKVNALCNKMGEGVKFVRRHNVVVDENDDKVDIVVWIDFSDGKMSKFIGFGQCKTGTTWEDDRFQLQPVSFCKKWLHTQPVTDPIRMFFVADIVEEKIWYKRSVDAGLLFDRLRIMDYFPEDNVPIKLSQELKAWTLNAIKFAASNLS